MADEKRALGTVEEEDTTSAEEYHDVPSKPPSRKASRQKEQKKRCPMYFGVRSYLHDFYDSTKVYKDPDVYEEDDDFTYLLHPNPRRRRCPPIWWKIFMWIGVNLLVFGIIGILVGYLVPQKSIFYNVDTEKNEGYVDQSAVAFNTTLDACKLIGLILFCVGGMTLAMALLFPSFLTSYCDEDPADDTFKVKLKEDEKAPLSPVEMTIPSTSKLKSVQPTRSSPESTATQQGVVQYKD